jgi:hypothetical protein
MTRAVIPFPAAVADPVRRRGRPTLVDAQVAELRDELHAVRAELEADLAVLYPLARQWEFLSREFGPATHQCAMAMLARLGRMARRLVPTETVA